MSPDQVFDTPVSYSGNNQPSIPSNYKGLFYFLLFHLIVLPLRYFFTSFLYIHLNL